MNYVGHVPMQLAEGRIILNAACKLHPTWEVPEECQLFVFWLSSSLYFYTAWKRNLIVPLFFFFKIGASQASQNRLIDI